MKAKVTIISADAKVISALVGLIAEWAGERMLIGKVGPIENTPAFNDEQAIDITLLEAGKDGK